MRLIRRWIFSLCAIAGLAASPAYALQQGEMAPDFEAKDTKGVTQKLSDYKGKLVVLEWTNPGCPFVVKHYDSQNMQQLQKKHTENGAIWLSINSSASGKEGHMTSDAANAYLAEKKAMPTALIQDEKGDIGRMYGAKTTPHMFIIDKEGKIAYMGAIDSIPSADKADVAKAENYIDKAMAELMADKTVTTASTTPYGCSVKYGEMTTSNAETK